MRALLLLLLAGCVSTEDGILSSVDSAEIYPQGVFDVTTVYDLRGEEDTTENTRLVGVEGCYVDGTNCNWKMSGWNESDSNYASVPFPSEVLHEGTTHNTQQPKVIRVTTKKFAVSIKPVSTSVDFYIFLMAEEDVELSDMLVMVLRNDKGKSNFYRCLQTLAGNDPLPTMSNRKCAKLHMIETRQNSEPYDTSTFNSFSLEIDGDIVRVVYTKNQQVWFELDVAEEFREMVGAINYVGIRTDGDFKYSIPKDVLALSRRRGSLTSQPIATHSGTTLLCVQMTAYIHPESDGNVALSLRFDNGTNLNVGEFSTTDDKVQLWRFMGVIKADYVGFRVHIESSKINTHPLVITEIKTCTPSGEFGNVVFNRSGPVKVHLRTNARGLPLILPDGTIKSPSDGVHVPECTSSPACAWTQNNFTRTNVGELLRPLLNIGNVNGFVDWLSSTKPVTKARRFQSPLSFKYDVTNGNHYGTFSIFLMDILQDVQRSDMYLLDLRWNSAGSTYLYKCTRTDISSYVTIPGGSQRRCSAVVSYSFQWYFSTNENFTFKLENNSGRITLTVGRSDSQLVVFNWADPSPILTTHFALGTDQVVSGDVRGIPEYPVFWLSQLTGSLVSPPLPPSVDRVCVSLVYYTDEIGASIDLQMQQDNVETQIGTFLLAQSHKTGVWSHRNVIVQVPRSSRSETRLVVVAATRNEGTDLLIQRVGGCNAEAPEDVLVLEKEPIITAIDVSHYYNYSAEVHQDCLNGGVKHKGSSCVCPPGFRGSSCSEGCGANSYGSDCGGVCSESVEGCRGMALCKPVLGCECAAGFKGLLCDTPCDVGEYGAGCRQQCGKCADNSCDAYTGVCHHGCLSGHYPPFCQELYAYINDRPTVNANGFHDATVISRLDYYGGRGRPHFYQIQYKEYKDKVSDQEPWLLGSTQLCSEKTSDLKGLLQRNAVDSLTGLKPGTKYLVRTVLIDSSFASYQGDFVRTTAFSTPCIVPQEADYLYYENKDDSNEVTVSSVDHQSFKVDWKVTRGNATWCELIGYEIHVQADWRQMVHSVSSDVTHKVVTSLSPGKEYRVKVRAVTKQGAAVFTHAQTVKTMERSPDHVRNLQLTLAAERSLKISWEEPRRTAGNMRRYVVSYQCLRLGACPEVDCAGSAGKMEVMSTNAQLESLLPYALYRISVAGISGAVGPSSSIQAVTTLGVPEVAPSSANPALVSRTNSSFSVQWAAPESCKHLNGYLTGYRYELLSIGQKSPLLVGTTTNTSASFSGLVPHSDFVVRVLATNSAGWATAHALEILVKTRATTPEVVEKLTVYKRGRRMLGLRWSPPRLSYGTIESFTVTHRPLDGSHKAISWTLTPNPCPAWPQLFCHTIKHLKADTDYIVAVQARNSEVSEDGEEVAIKATTKEGVPGAPSFLRVTNTTDVALTIEWGLPDMVNGQLRSFLVNIEETDSHNASDCCQYFPIKEVIVNDETGAYQFQMTGLKPASSYEVGVTAKTVSLGPAVSLTAHTRPRTPVLAHAPRLAEPANMWDSLRVHVEPSVDYKDDIVRGYMLLIKGDTNDDVSPISDDWLANELKVALNGSFSLAADFNHMDLPEEGIVVVNPGLPLVDGIFGSVGMNALLLNTEYQLVWVLVLEYHKTLSVGYILGDAFTLTGT